MPNRFFFIGVLFLLNTILAAAQADKWTQLEASADTSLAHQDFKKAVQSYTKIIVNSGLKKKEDFQPVYKRAFCFYSLEQYDLALKDLDRFITEMPEMTRARILRSFVFKDMGKRDRQIDDLTFVIQAQEPRPDLLKWRGEAYLDTGNYALAKNDLVAARFLADDDEVELHLGIAYYNMGLVDSAFNSLNTAIELNPTSIPIYMYSTSFCLQEEAYGLALKYINVALMLQPQNPTAMLYKGIALMELGRKDEGCRFLTKAFQAGEDDAGDYLEEYCYNSND